MTVVIGLTGSIASGKSTIADQLRDCGMEIIDADKIAREVVEPGERAYTEIVDAFGSSILLPDETIDRGQLGERIFNDEQERQTLNSIVHPAIRKKMIDRRDRSIERGDEAVVLDIPLLFESKLTHFVEKILVVSVQPHVQIDRLMKRNELTNEEATRRISSQIPVQEKEALADAVIDNNGTKEESYKQLHDILQQWGILDIEA